MMTRREFLAALPAAASLPLLGPPCGGVVVGAGYVKDGPAWKWVELGTQAELEGLAEIGYLAYYSGGMDPVWLADYRASLEGLFGEAKKAWLPIIRKD